MKARLGWFIAIVGAGAVALSAAAQGSAKLAVGPDAGGYLCPDGRKIWVSRCYDQSAQASCQVVHLHVKNNGLNPETASTRTELLASLKNCVLTPLEFTNSGVNLVVPKSAPPQQTAKAPAAAPAPSAATPTIPGPATRTALIRISGPGVAKTVHYVDEASAKPTGQKDVVEIWALQVFPNGNPNFPNANALWTRNDVDCKKNTNRLRVWGTIDRQGKVLSAESTDIVQPVVKNSPNEKIAAVACSSTPFGGSRILTVTAAIADADNAAAPTTAAKPSTPAAKPVAVRKPATAPIHLPNTDSEKLFFQMVRENKFQAAIDALLTMPEDKRKSLVELTDDQGMTPLHWAAANRNAAALRWLLDKQAALDLTDKKGRTPLKIALDNKDTRVMSILLDRGAYAPFALPGHDEELKGITTTGQRVDFMIKNAAPAAPAAQPDAAAQARLDLLEEADRHFVDDEFELAIPLYERAMVLDPKDVETAEQICTLYFLYVDTPEKGVIACERLLKLNPKDLAFPHSAIARLQKKRGDNRKALVSALEWARLEPAKSYAWTTLADIYVALGRNQDALAAVQKAVTLEPADWSHLAQRGDIFRRLGKFTESIADYKAGIAIWPEGPTLHHDLSVVLRAAGRKTEADAEQRLAIDLALSRGRNVLKKPVDGSPLSIDKMIAAQSYLEMLEKWDKSAAAKLAAEIKASER